MKRTILVVLLNLSIAFLIINTSCNNTNTEKQVEFYYYPKSNVYYNVEKNAYLYSLNGGKSWENLILSSEDPPATLGEKIVLYSATDSIWKDNEAHRKLYAGVLYNVATNDSTTTAVASHVTERRSSRKFKSQDAGTDETVKKEKPLRRFFNRIFGKRKKQE